MDRDGSRNPFGGRDRISAILVTLFLSFFAIAVFYILYRQFNGGWERLGVIDPWRNALAHTLDQNKKPILWDVYIGEEKLEWEWRESTVTVVCLLAVINSFFTEFDSFRKPFTTYLDTLTGDPSITHIWDPTFSSLPHGAVRRFCLWREGVPGHGYPAFLRSYRGAECACKRRCFPWLETEAKLFDPIA